MRTWGIRAALVVSLVSMNLLEGAILRPLIRTIRINFEATLLDELLMGVVMGVVVCCIYEGFRRSYERKLKAAVDELNHHVRNSLQVIVNQQVLGAGGNPGKVSDAMHRVDWALREILPKEMQPR
jgi:two-component sensor histidine kinase